MFKCYDILCFERIQSVQLEEIIKSDIKIDYMMY